MKVTVPRGTKAKRKLEYGDLVIHVLEYARYNADLFVFGPLNQKSLLDRGLVLEGDIEGVTKVLKTQFPEFTYED